MTEDRGCWMNHQIGKITDTYVDLALPGGIRTSRRLITPRVTRSRLLKR